MLRDITIGQYFPKNSLVHKLDPRTKIIITFIYIFMLFIGTNFFGYLLNILFLLFSYLIAQIHLKLMFKSLKPILPILIFTTIVNLFFVSGDKLFQFYFITISKQGLILSIAMSVRIIALIAGTSLLTYTTSPISLTDGIEKLMKPLTKLKFPAHEVAMMMTIALRFIPTLIEETDKIMSAQKARGADMETGGIVKRAKALIPILIPLFVSSFRRADELALAMECRCYKGGEGRTRMKVLKFCLRDFVSIVLSLIFLTAIVIINIIFKQYNII